MNKILLSLLFFVLTQQARSQKIYFVYLQSENNQAFFVKLDEKIYSSSASGYLILSKLKDTTHAIRVGFPQGKWPEQHFSIQMGRKDRGYLLKNFQDKGWGLFDLQTLGVQMSSGAGTGKTDRDQQSSGLPKDESAFTNILAKVADDPTIKEKTVRPKPADEKMKDPVVQEVVKKEEMVAPRDTPVQKTSVKMDNTETKNAAASTEKMDTAMKAPVVQVPMVKKETPETKTAIINTVKKDTMTEKPAETIPQQVVKTEPVLEDKKEPTLPKETITTEYKRSVITRRSESSTSDGFGLTFIDEMPDGNKDTIKILIPHPGTALAKKEIPREEKRFLDITAETTKTEQEKNVVLDTAQKLSSPVVAGGKCAGVAEEADFFKLRKTMAAAEGDDDMIMEARKYFKTKCFMVAQIKNLASLFLSDEGKYRFFDLAYGYAADPVNFASLQTELKEEYYINRFKAMLRN